MTDLGLVDDVHGQTISWNDESGVGWSVEMAELDELVDKYNLGLRTRPASIQDSYTNYDTRSDARWDDLQEELEEALYVDLGLPDVLQCGVIVNVDEEM